MFIHGDVMMSALPQSCSLILLPLPTRMGRAGSLEQQIQKLQYALSLDCACAGKAGCARWCEHPADDAAGCGACKPRSASVPVPAQSLPSLQPQGRHLPLLSVTESEVIAEEVCRPESPGERPCMSQMPQGVRPWYVVAYMRLQRPAAWLCWLRHARCEVCRIVGLAAKQVHSCQHCDALHWTMSRYYKLASLE